MKLPKELTTVTILSKTIALIMFILLPFIGFMLGIRYQEMVDLIERQELYNNLTSINRTPTPTPEKNSTIDTSTWKTYTEPTLQFQIKYPPNWEYSEIREGNPLHLSLYPKHTSNMKPRESYDPLAPINLQVLNISPSESLQCLSEPNENTCLDIQVDGIPAKRYQRNTYYDIVAFKKNDKLFELMSPKFDQSVFSKGQYPRAYYAFYNLPTEERKRIFDQILSTFRFSQ
ncbi:MAG: hypothetical protein Q7K55_05120 [Candidatus Levybacteria bacterium]|nr:hypothetical protein [Candidatus Levybacteria bacterium]